MSQGEQWCVVCGANPARSGSLFCGADCERDSIRYHEELANAAQDRFRNPPRRHIAHKY
jgi:hypothetical protein